MPSGSAQPHARLAFTLVELLVVIAIIGIMIGMLLPAVQQVREAARRVNCMNNIRQLSIGMHNYQSAFQHLPPGYINVNPASGSHGWPAFIKNFDDRSGTPFEGNLYGWGAFILPYVEATNVFDRLEFNESFGNDKLKPNGTSLGSTVIPTFICPSDSGDDFNHSYCSNVNQKNAKSNYVACTGHETWPSRRVDPAYRATWGMFGENEVVSMNDCRDGTSNVILLGERTSLREVDSVHEIQGAIWIGNFNVNNSHLGSIFPPRSSNVGRTGGPTLIVNGDSRARNIASSSHPGGAIVVMTDGSTRFVSDHMDYVTLQRMAMRQDGEVIAN